MLKEEYLKLCETVDYHMNRYYNEDAPEITDFEYDNLMLQIKEAEKEHPEWVTPDSPTQKIGGTAKREAGVTVTHNVPMLSIQDVFTKEDVIKWVREVREVYPDANFSVEQKIDGLSMSLRYTDGKLTLAETRGDGLVGEDVTLNAFVIPDVLRNIDLLGYVELRGEVYMSHEDFDRFNERQEILGKKLAANPRNLAAGTLRQLDSAITKERGLRMYVFNVQDAHDGSEELMVSHVKGLDKLDSLGIAVAPHTLCRTEEEIINCIDDIGERRGELAYDIDGAVIKIDQIEYRDAFSGSSKYSAGHIAYKYPPEERVVVLDDILIDVGRTGKLTFTGVFYDKETFKSARLCGTKVSRATLHNQDYINEMKIGIGGAYKLFKSGEIIPKFNGCVIEPREIFIAPSRCPVCGSILQKEDDITDIRCFNSFCHAQLTRTISYFASLDAMNIMGLGDSIVEALVKCGYINSFSDIYKLKNFRSELVESGIIGKEKGTDKVLNAIEKSKNNPPYKLLIGLGIRNVGKNTAKNIMKRFKTITELEDASFEELVSIEDVGETIARCVIDFFNNETNRQIVNELLENGVAIGNNDLELCSDKLKGLIIVVTGTLPTLGRKEVSDLIENNGGKCTSSVSKKTDYLVVGEEAGSKLAKAQSLGVQIISEEELLRMIQ